MNLSFTEKKNIRKNFGKLKETLSIPNLIEVQKQSYSQLTDQTLNDDVLPKGLARVLKAFFQLMILMKRLRWNMLLLNYTINYVFI